MGLLIKKYSFQFKLSIVRSGRKIHCRCGENEEIVESSLEATFVGYHFTALRYWCSWLVPSGRSSDQREPLCLSDSEIS